MPLDTTNPFNVKVDHNFAKIDDAIGFFPRAWRAAKKYSVSNTLPIAAVNTWLQFSLAYVAAIIITHNDLSFITDILNPTFMPVYALVSVILFTTLIVSSAIRYMHKHKIKEGKKSIEELINDKIRGGKDNEVSEIAENALKIEIIPVIDHKKASFSIVLPISEDQKKVLESQREENKNKAIFLTIPYAVSALIIVGALIQNRFSFANVQGLEWTVVALASTIAIVGMCITFGKLKNNEISNNHNYVKRFHNIDIIFPCRRGVVVSVMEKKTKDEEENDSISRLIKLLDKHLTDFTDKISDSFDKFLDEAKTSIDKKLLEPVNVNIGATLNSIKGDLKVLFDDLEKIIEQDVDKVKKNANKEITMCLQDISKSIDESLKEVRIELKEKLNQLQPSGIGNYLIKFIPAINNRQAGDTGDSHDQNHSLESDDDAEFFDCSVLTEENKKEIIQEVRKITNDVVQNKLELIQKQLATLQANGSPDSALGSKNVDNTDQLTLENTVKARRKTVKNLELEEENNRLIKKEQKLTQKKSEQEKMDEWREKINGKASDFLYYLLESIKLEEKDDNEEKIGERTLKSFNNKIIIHWKDGSQTIFDIKKQHDLQAQPSTKVDFVDQDIHAAFKVAHAG